MTAKLSRAEWIALVFAILVASGFLLHQWWFPSYLYDAGQYAKMGHNIVEHGLFSRFTASALRTYGFPVFLSVIYLVAGTIGVPDVLLLFLVQFGLYLTATTLLRRSLMYLSPLAARVSFCGLMLNYYSLLYTPECLTESLSLSTLLLLGAGWLEAYRRRGPIWLLSALSLLAGFAILIRPANIFMAITWLAGATLLGFRGRFGRTRLLVATSVIAVSVSLPLLPQLAYNGLRFGRWTPLLAQDLGKMQQAWGIRDIKYATAMPPSPEARVHYVNPWLHGTDLNDEAPLAWYVGNPGRGALTLAVHSFNLVDQDLLFTYSRDLDPWYRIPLGLINHAAVALGLIGLLLCFRAVHSAGNQTSRDAVALLAVMLTATWAMHVWTAVEMRFGFALLCALFPLAGYAIARVWQSASVRSIVSTTVVVAAYVAGALQLSSWVRDQSPLIHAIVTGQSSETAGDDGGRTSPGAVSR